METRARWRVFFVSVWQVPSLQRCDIDTVREISSLLPPHSCRVNGLTISVRWAAQMYSCCAIRPLKQNAPSALVSFKTGGNRGRGSETAMLFNLKALATVLFLSTAIGAATDTPGHFEIEAQPKGIDVSSYQHNVNWTAVVAHGVSFAYIKATEGTSKAMTVVVGWDADLSFQPSRTLTSLPSTPVLQGPVSFVVPTTMPFHIILLVLLRPTGLPPTAEAGVRMA